MDEQNKNLILATALSFIVILVWLFVGPKPEVSTPIDGTEQTTEGTVDDALVPAAPVGTTAPATIGTEPQGRADALANAPR
ncbi:MAG: membrane protein insertase YidC, partial [Sulfitobacter sp.]